MKKVSWLLVFVFGCTENKVPTLDLRPSLTGVVVAVSFPREPEQFLVRLNLNIHNGSKEELKVLNFSQAVILKQLRIVPKDNEGRGMTLQYPLDVGRPREPSDKDYLSIKPGESLTLDFWVSCVSRAYACKPGNLYFIECELYFKDKKEPARFTFPYGITTALANASYPGKPVNKEEKPPERPKPRPGEKEVK